MANDKTAEELQQQARELLRAQQEAFLAAVKEWRKTFATTTKEAPPPWPQPPFDTMPSAAEMAQANYAFASKLLADQSRFMEELGKAMTEKE